MSYPTCAEESRLHCEFAASSSTASEHARFLSLYKELLWLVCPVDYRSDALTSGMTSRISFNTHTGCVPIL